MDNVQQDLFSLEIRVTKATRLPLVPGGNIFKERKPPNPYVIIRSSAQQQRTVSIAGTVAPIWDSSFTFSRLSSDSALSVALYHAGHKRNRLLRETNISVADLLGSPMGEDISLTLSSPEDAHATSSVTVRVSAGSPPSEPTRVGNRPSSDVPLADEPTTEPEIVRILSLDGGGVRGLSSLLILREIMNQMQTSITSGSHTNPVSTRGPLKPCDVFELIMGTGTGGLSALFLGRLHMTVDQAISEYIGLSDAVTKSLLQSSSIFDAKPLEKHLSGIIAKYLGDPDQKIFENTNARCRTAVLAATSDYVDAPAYIFRSYSGAHSARILEVARATTATAGVFPSISFGHPPMTFIDAGSVGFNNPTEVAADEAQKIWPHREIDVMLSLGTGTQPIISLGKGRSLREIANLSKQLIESCEAVHNRVSNMYPTQTYFRFSVDRGLDTVGIMEWSAAGKNGPLAGITSAYLRQAKPSLDLAHCVEALCGRTVNMTSPYIRYSRYLGVERSAVPVDAHGMQEYIRDHVEILQPITNQVYMSESGGKVIISLHRAQRRTDGRMVLMKTYEWSGMDSTQAQQYHSQDLTSRKRLWSPLLTQLVGMSCAGEWVPFQIYHMPAGQFEGFRDWFIRTGSSNPTESICGLYDMRTSIRALSQFQKERDVVCEGNAENLFWSSVVQIQHSGGEWKWKLIYSGEVVSGTIEPEIFPHDSFIAISEPRRKEIQHRFLRGAQAWTDSDERDLDGVLPVVTEGTTFPSGNITTLVDALLDRGWLGVSFDPVEVDSCIRLGDLIYTNPQGHVVVVTNLHYELTSTTGGAPTWSHLTRYSDPEEVDWPEGTHTESFSRYHLDFQSGENIIDVQRLAYKDLNEKHAWKLLKSQASLIAASDGVSVDPHDLMLVVEIEKHASLDLLSSTGADTDSHSVYVFIHGEGDKDSNPPTFPRTHVSFDRNPDEGVIDMFWQDAGNSETHEDLELEYSVFWQSINYFQLPNVKRERNH